jgi:two-component system, NarL family, invasion response regulator UvrY
MIRILLADDHSVIREGVRLILEETGDLVVCGDAANGTELLNMLPKQDWDLLVLDISMPGRNGLELIKIVRKQYSQLPILVMSMHPETQYALRALRAGASGYVTKDSGSATLIAAMRKVAVGGVFISDATAEILVRDRWAAPEDLPETPLSDRELQVFEKIVAGEKLMDIARDLGLSIKTVSTHKTNILKKMGMETEADMVRYAMLRDLGALPE